MPRKKNQAPTRDIARENFEQGQNLVHQHPIFSPLFYHVRVVRELNNLCPRDGWAVITREGALHVHPTRRGDPAEWAYVIAHCLLHLGFGHFQESRQNREWNAACDLFIARFLADLKFGRPPDDMGDLAPASARDEDRLYAELHESGLRPGFQALGTAGPRADDMIWGPEQHDWRGRPFDWRACFGQGLAAAVTDAVSIAAGEDPRAGRQRTAAGRARAWFIDHYPLLGALAATFEIIEDPQICMQYGISVAAVDAERREIYINPAAGLDEEEHRFVMAHELLHVGLRHDTRAQGRDHFLWNVACFPADTWTGYGQPIQDVAMMRRHYAGELIEVEAQGSVVNCTPDHPFYARRRKGRSYPIQLADPQWIAARDLMVGDYLLVPRLKEKRVDTVIDLRPYIQEGADSKGRATFGNRAVKEIPLNETTAWLIGLYVAEGSASPKVQLSLGIHETALANRAVAAFQAIGYQCTLVPTKSNSLTVQSGTTVFGRWLKEHCGINAHTKCIPRVILAHEDPLIRKAFLNGLCQGDGHTRQQSSGKTLVSMVGSVSERLIADLALLLAQDGIGGSRRIMRRGPRLIGETWTDTQLTLHTFHWNPDGVAPSSRILNGSRILTWSQRWRADDEGVWYRVRELTRSPFEGDVYNLTTDDHTYIANAFLVHNCDFVINAWLVEMGVGTMPRIGALHDPSLKGESAESIYDRILLDMRRMNRLATFRGAGLGDILGPNTPGWWSSGPGADLDDFYRRALSQGLLWHQEQGRGFLPDGLVEEIRALSYPPVPWDVELARWFDEHFPPLEERRSYARPSRRQSATPDIPRPSYVPHEDTDEGRTFGVVLDTSGSMEPTLLAMALGAIASYSIARDVPAVRVVFCDAAPYDEGYLRPEDIAGRVRVRGRGGTVLQPGIDLLEQAEDFPKDGPLLVITDGYCDRLQIRRDHAFLVPEGHRLPFVPRGPVFRIK